MRIFRVAPTPAVTFLATPHDRDADIAGLCASVQTACARALALSVNSPGDIDGNALPVRLQGTSVQVAPVPVPASLPLLASALLVAGGMGGCRRK